MRNNNAAGKTILVVDDDGDAREMLMIFLQHTGYRVIDAANGEEAVEKALRELPDLILMDLHLPKLDGFSAARRIRQHPELLEVPILTNSADGMKGIDYTLRSHELGAGYTDYFTKPVDLEELAEMIDRLLSNGS